MKSLLLRAGFALLALGAPACNSPGDPSEPPAPIVPAEGVRVTPQVVQFSRIGETRQLVATVSPVDATDQAVTWESTDSSVASVDAGGLVTAKAAGIGVFITVYTRDGRHEASVNVSVIP